MSHVKYINLFTYASSQLISEVAIDYITFISFKVAARFEEEPEVDTCYV